MKLVLIRLFPEDTYLMKRIILTGGGTAGHVTPNIALLPRLSELGYDIQYIGSYNGIEKDLIEPFGVPYHGISSGKLRRYLSMQNLTDPFRVLKGFSEARKLIKELKPDVIFSKGGFVSVPVVLAGKRCKVPVIIHESDMTPGLANKIAIPSATKVCCNFPETLEYLPKGKAVLTGSPIRQELLSGSGNKIAALDLCGFTADKPVILVIGGSLGSVVVNNAVRKSLPKLLEHFQVIHLCGKGKTDESLNGTEGYCQRHRRLLPVRICQRRTARYLRTCGSGDLPCGRQCHLRAACLKEAEPSDPALGESQPRRPDPERPLLRAPGLQHGHRGRGTHTGVSS